MKKAVVLGMILLALGCMAYADGVTVGMDFGRSQFVLAQNSGVSGADTMQSWAPNSGTFPNTQRYDMQFAWTNDHVGINITGYMQPWGQMLYPIAGVGGIGVDWVNMYGTLKLIPDMFTAYLGRFEGDGWDHFRMDSAHPIHDVDNNSVGRFAGWGMILDLMPKDSGIDVGVFMKTHDPSAIPNGGIDTLSHQASQYDIAASYTVPNLVKITAGSTTFGYYPTPQRNVFARGQILMIPNLTLWDDFWYRGFDMSPSTTIFSDELAASYVMGPLTIVFAGFYTSDNTAGSSSVVSWIKLYPEVYYNLGFLTVGLYAGYAMETKGGVNNNGSVIDVEPYIKLNDFGLRVSVHYQSVTPLGSTTATGSWEIPIIIDWGF